MSKKTKKALAPELRFPEFWEAGEWELKNLGEVLTSVSNGLNFGQINDDTGYKVTRIETISDKTINLSKVGFIKTEQDISSYKLCIGDILFSNINSLSHIGKVVFVDQDYDLYHGMNLLRLVVHKELNDAYFLFYQLDTENIKKSFKKRANQAVNQASINQTELKKTTVVVPKLREQQKIADCLSSIDDLLTSQTQKIEAIKAHKKGLMQQLFPAEGETVPRLRFPEFQEAGEWNISTIDEIASIASGGTPNRSKPEYWNGNIPWVSTTLIDFNKIECVNEFITELGLNNSSAKKFSSGTILMAMYGQGKTRGKVAILGIGASINQACAAISLKQGMNTEFVFQNLAARYDEIREISNQGSQDNLSATLIKTIPFSFPDIDTGEQQKIADCLSSIDDLITAQTQKLEALKANKKGMMQRLFPPVDEADA